MVDLLQIESISTPRPAQTQSTERSEQETEGAKPKMNKQDAVEYSPTTTNPKVPILRRSALHFLSLLTRVLVAQVEDVSTVAVYALPGDLMRRAKTTVGYIAATDVDLVVRVMAKEALEGLSGLAEAVLGVLE